MPRLSGDEADDAPNPFRIEIPRLVLPRLAQLDGTGPIQLHRAGDGWLATFEEANEVVFLDDHLKRLRRISVALPVENYVRPEVGLDSLCGYLAVSYSTAISGYALPSVDGKARHLWKIDQGPWPSFQGTSCAIDGRSRLWWIRRDSDQKEWVTVSAIETGTTLAEAELAESYDCHYGIVLHPDGDSAMLDGGAGQDGTFLWKVVFRAGRLSVQALSSDDRIMGGFSPDGMRFVTAPHHIGAITIHRWGDCAVIDRFPGERVFLGEDSGEASTDHFDFQATFFGDQRVIADTRQGRLLLMRTDPLRVDAELWPQGSPILGYGDEGQRVHDARAAVDFERDLYGWLVARNKLLAAHRGGGLSVWDLSALGDAERSE